MGRQQKIVTDPFEAIDALARRIRALETSSQLGKTTARGGGTQWADTSGVVHVLVGDLGDGTNGLSTDGRVAASGAMTAASLVTTGGVTAGTSLSAADHNASSNVPTVTPGGVKIFVQSTDPGAAANNGDIWINTS